MSQVEAKSTRHQLYRLTLRQFETMIGAGVFGDERVELLDGMMVNRMTSFPPHDFAVMNLVMALRQMLPESHWTVREEKSVLLGSRSRPEPDIAVVRGTLRDYAQRPPTEHDIALLIEVSDSTYPKDAGVKHRLYERSGVPEYWIVDLQSRQVEVFTLDQRVFGPPMDYAEADEVPVSLDGREFGRIAVSALLTPPPTSAPAP
jgi:Uma2 family endonuclease